MMFADCTLSRICVAISRAVFVLAVLVVSHHQARAEARYPYKAVPVVLPFAAGGVADITARIVAEKLSDRLGQRFYVENQPGAGGIAAARKRIASAARRATLGLSGRRTAAR